MAVSTEGKIQAALLAHLMILTLSPPLPVALPNYEFEPPDNSEPYLRVQYLPNVSARLFIGAQAAHQHQGILQVSVVWPSGHGEIAPRDVAGAVAEHFNDGVQIPFTGGVVRIQKRPDIGPALQETHMIQIPVSINWYSYI